MRTRGSLECSGHSTLRRLQYVALDVLYASQKIFPSIRDGYADPNAVRLSNWKNIDPFTILSRSIFRPCLYNKWNRGCFKFGDVPFESISPCAWAPFSGRLHDHTWRRISPLHCQSLHLDSTKTIPSVVIYHNIKAKITKAAWHYHTSNLRSEHQQNASTCHFCDDKINFRQYHHHSRQ